MTEENELPNGWCRTTLGEICSKPQYGWTTKANPKYGQIRLLRTTDISSGLIDWNAVPFCTEIPENLSAYRLKEDDIVISRAGSVGVSYLLSIVPYETVFASYLIRFRPLKGIEPRYMAYYLQTSTYWASVYEQSSGIALANVNARKLEAFDIPLAPQTEQQRIVSAIEQQFTRLEAGVAALRRAQAKLKRYRAAVLKAAVEGKLTEAWRAEHPTTEPASILLERILKERRAKWEAELRAKGKDPAKVKYVEPAKPDMEGLPELPEGWVWVNLGQLTWSVKDGPHYSPKYVSEGIPFITGGNVRPSGVDFVNAKRITPELYDELSKRCKPQKGDILYTKGGTTGIARVNTYDNEFAVWVHVAVLKLCGPIETFYMQHVLNSPFCYEQAQRFTHGVGNQDLGLTRMVLIVLSLPPLAEQEQIVTEIETRISIINQIEVAIEANLKRAERLRQSILKEAFAGRLVPQDPNDEPASVLLERILKEREGQKKGANGNGRFVKVSDEPVQIDVEETRQVELWEGVGGGE